MLIVAASEAMPADVAERLKDFMKKGGKVVLTNGAVFSPDGKVHDFGIPGTFGVQSEFDPDYVEAAPDYVSTVKTPFLMRLGSRRFTTDDAHSLGKVYDPEFNRAYNHFCSHQHAPYKNAASGYSAGAMTDSVLYFAHPVFKIYEHTGMVPLRGFMTRAFFKFAGADLQVKTEKLPSTGRVTLMKQEGRYVMHALYAPTAVRGNDVPLKDMPNFQWGITKVEVIEDLVPVYGSTYSVLIPETVRSVRLVPEDQEIPFTVKNGRLEFTIPEFSCHAMVEISI